VFDTKLSADFRLIHYPTEVPRLAIGVPCATIGSKKLAVAATACVRLRCFVEFLRVAKKLLAKGRNAKASPIMYRNLAAMQLKQ
jgi:hypothetical protein